MRNVKIFIDEPELNKQLLAGSNSVVIKQVLQEALTKNLKAYIDLILKDFEDHPITREIDNGANSYNFSNTLNGYGNLYSFLGFPKGSKPLDKIRDLFYQEKQIEYFMEPSNRFIEVSINLIGMPTIEECYAATPMPWHDGQSWAERIEVHVSGINQFLAKRSKYSRSAGGIQITNGGSIPNRSFSPQPYLSKIFYNLENNITIKI